MSPDGRMERRTDMDKPISLRLRRRIIITNIGLIAPVLYLTSLEVL